MADHSSGVEEDPVFQMLQLHVEMLQTELARVVGRLQQFEEQCACCQQWATPPLQREAEQPTLLAVELPGKSLHEDVMTALLPVSVPPILPMSGDAATTIPEPLKRKVIGAYLLEAGLISAAALDEGLAMAQQTGIRLGRALLLLGHIREPELATFLAEQQGLVCFQIGDTPIDSSVARLIPERDARRWKAMPVAVRNGNVTVAMVDPLDGVAQQGLQAALRAPLVATVTTEQALEQLLEGLYQASYTDQSIRALLQRFPKVSASQVLTSVQKGFFVALVLVSVIWLWYDWVSYLVVANAVATMFYLAFTAHRLYLVQCAMGRSLEITVGTEEMAGLADRDLPQYTVLVPLYREAAVLPQLMAALARLDYPIAKLDIKLLMEADDLETIAAVEALGLPAHFQKVVVPDSLPKTKAKACNYGLIKAWGDFVVIYDAEDLPEPDQLKKVVVAFGKVDKEVACIQAKLNTTTRLWNGRSSQVARRTRFRYLKRAI